MREEKDFSVDIFTIKVRGKQLGITHLIVFPWEAETRAKGGGRTKLF